jgi:hypothetical protein
LADVLSRRNGAAKYRDDGRGEDRARATTKLASRERRALERAVRAPKDSLIGVLVQITRILSNLPTGLTDCPNGKIGCRKKRREASSRTRTNRTTYIAQDTKLSFWNKYFDDQLNLRAGRGYCPLEQGEDFGWQFTWRGLQKSSVGRAKNVSQ